MDNAAAGPAGGDVAAVQRAWPDIVEAVKRKSRATWMVIMSGVRPVSLDGRVLTLQFDAEGSRLGFVNGNRDVILCEVLKEGMGVDWRIETVTSGGPAGGGRAGGASRANPGGRAGAGGSAPSGGFGSASSSGFGSASSSGFGSASTGGFGSASSAPGPSGGFGSEAVQDVRPNPGPAPMPRPPADPVPPPDEPPPPPEPEPVDEREEVDPEGDADVEGNEAEMTGMALIQRELGGQVIREIDNS